MISYCIASIYKIKSSFTEKISWVPEEILARGGGGTSKTLYMKKNVPIRIKKVPYRDFCFCFLGGVGRLLLPTAGSHERYPEFVKVKTLFRQ